MPDGYRSCKSAPSTYGRRSDAPPDAFRELSLASNRLANVLWARGIQKNDVVLVILAPGTSGDEALVKALQDHVKKVTAPYKYPRKIEFVSELPKPVNGKIRRVELRDQEWQRKSLNFA